MPISLGEIEERNKKRIKDYFESNYTDYNGLKKLKNNNLNNIIYENQLENYNSNKSVDEKKQDYRNSTIKKIKEEDKLYKMYADKGVITKRNYDPEPAGRSWFLSEKDKDLLNYNNSPTADKFYENFKKYTSFEKDEKGQAEEKNKEKFNELSQTDEFKKQQAIIDAVRLENAANYMNYTQSKLDEDDIGFYDKTLGSFFGGATSFFSNLGTPLLENDEGALYHLPSYNELKHEKVINSYGDGFFGTAGKIGSSALYEGGRIAVTSAINSVAPGLGTGIYFTDIYAKQYNSAVAEGNDSSSATAYAVIGTATEFATEKLLGGTTNAIFKSGSSELSNSIGSLVSKVIKNNPRVVNIISNATSEGLEEFVQEYIDKFNRNLTLNENNKVFSVDTFEDAVYSAAVGALTGGFSNINNTSTDYLNNNNNQINNAQIQNNNIENALVNDAVNNKIAENNLMPKLDQQSQNNKDLGILPEINTRLYSQSGSIPSVYQYEKTNNSKINNLKESATKYFNNSRNTHNFIDNISKIISDKNYNVIFDDKIVNDKGQSVNAQIKPLANGEVEIRLNPNSPKSGEFLIIHEVTHAIETNEMKALVLDYASKHSDFEQALNDLKATYGTEDVSSEVLADISGQLFGNQEFINNLSLEKPSIFKRIYNLIISLANKITGNSHEALFIKDLKNKWETAYRTTTQEQAINNVNDAKYHVSANLSSDIDNVLNNISERNPVRLRDYTPDVMVQSGIKNLPMYENPSHIRKNILTASEAQNLGLSITPKDHYHGLGKDTYIKTIDSLDNPRVIFKRNNSNDYIVLTTIKDGNNNNIIVPIEIETTTNVNNIKIDTNRIKTVYGYDIVNPDLNDYIRHNLKNNEFTKIYEQKKERGTGNSTVASSSKDNITQSNDNVKLPTKYSMQENVNNTHDNQGRKLSQQQQEYFKDSVLRDQSGNLQVYYNGGGDYNSFDNTKMSDQSKWGKGIYLSKYQDVSQLYGDNIREVYANITNPLSQTEKTISFDEYNSLYQNLYDGEKAYQEEYDMYDNDLDLLWDITDKGNWADYAESIKKFTGKDGIVVNSESKADDMAIAFQSNQIKNVDNTNPTTNNDIRYSQNSSKWQEYLDKHYKPTGTRTNMSDIKIPTSKDINKTNMPPVSEEIKNNNKILNPNEISQLTSKDANTTPKLSKINRNNVNDGNSKFAKNIENKTNMLNEEQKSKILSEDEVKYYDKVTNKESLNKAFDRLNNNGKSESLRWSQKDSANADSTDVAEGWILMKQYADSGDYDGMVEIAKKMRDIGSKAGQTVQAFNIMERMTPEGMVKYAQSELQEAYEKMIKNKSKEWIDKYRSDFDLKPDEVQFIMDTMKEVSTMEDGYDKRVKLAEIQKLMTDKLPPTKGSGIKSWMRISMLFNPKTQVRNIAGNAIIMPVNSFGDLFASYADKIVAKKTGVRTTGKTNVKAILKGMKEGAYQATNDYKKGINTKDMEGNRFEITEGKNFNDKTLMGKSLNKVEGMLNYVMDAGDRVFSQAAFENSLQNQLVLNNTTEVTQDMLDIARTESLQRTWNDNNTYTKFVLGIRRMMNKIHLPGVESYGLGDILIPFAKTPANLTKAIVDYSPAGLVKTLVEGNNLRKSLTNGQFTPQMQHRFVQDLGKATAGTMLYVLGYALAKAGVISGESDDDKDVSNFMKNTLGISSYSIKIGNKSFTYDWAQPIAAPLSIMANINQKQKENATLLENVTSSLNTAGSILLEQSFFESIKTVFSNNEGFVSGVQEAILELPARAVPTFSKQIADMVDGTQRTSFEYGKPIKSAINSIKAKIPFVSKTLAPTVDTMGREVQKYGGKNNIFNVFLNPANVNTENISKSAEEIYRLYKETGEVNIMPRVAPYYVNKKGEKITLTSNQRAQYQETSGKIIENSIKQLLKTAEYKNMTDKEKSEVVSDIVNYSYNIAQKEVLGTELSQTYEKAYEYSQIGDIEDYYLFKNSIDIDNKKESISKFLLNSDLKDKELAFLYGNYYSTEEKLDSLITMKIPIKEFIKLDSANIEGAYDYRTGKTISGSKKTATINYINTLNLSVPQKAILIKMNYNSYKKYDRQIVNYINGLSQTKNDKMVLLKRIGFDDYDSEVIKYIMSKYSSKEKREKALKDLGFTIRNGRVYW